MRAVLCVAIWLAGCATASAQTGTPTYSTDVEPILAMARLDRGAAIDPVGTYRAAGYRARVATLRPARAAGGGGIV